ncbi:cell envelope biogenesis protein TolA [Sphingomonas sp. FW199]|uniref:cell envelope biogenesis protein TolA n=1 Tax=Sphingomonas sp. FW199 TaxID=3400217 RepID=UPI003CFB9E53
MARADRSEWIGFGVAVLAHLALFALLSVFLSRPATNERVSAPMDVSLVDDVALISQAPPTTEAPATSVAPDFGPPEDAAAPEPVPETPAPAPVAKTEAPAPKPVPKPVPPKAQPKPPAAKADRSPRPETPARPAPKSAQAASKQAGTAKSSNQARPTGGRLGDNFLKGIVANESPGKGATPRGEQVGAQAVANLAQAIQRQVQPCANRIPNPGPGANEIRSRIRLQLSPDGTMAARPQLRGQTGVTDENRRYSQRVAELAIAAFIQCAPYELPADLYAGGWEDIIINYRLP